MPTLEWSKATWDGRYDWGAAGDEWSGPWGGTAMEWYGTLLPRIHRFLPARTILEIAPGFGRWTQFLKDWCRQLIVVDLSQSCIEACQKRFAGCPHISYHVNDGRSLEMIADHSLDFVFSFDALVHADETVMAAYVSQLSKKLTPNGVAFLHHSNLGEYRYFMKLEKTPRLIRRTLRRLGVLEHTLHARDFSMTASKMRSLADAQGLRCISQEIVPWSTRRAMIDCLTTLTGAHSVWARDSYVFRNAFFTREAAYWSELSRLYGTGFMASRSHASD